MMWQQNQAEDPHLMVTVLITNPVRYNYVTVSNCEMGSVVTKAMSSKHTRYRAVWLQSSTQPAAYSYVIKHVRRCPIWLSSVHNVLPNIAI